MTKEERLEIISMMQEVVSPINQRLDTIDQRLDRVDERLDKVDQRLDKMDERLDKMDQRLDKMDDRFDKIDERLDSLETSHRELRVLIEIDIRREINLIAEGHLDLARNLKEDLKLRKRVEAVENKVSGIEYYLKNSM